MDKKTVSENTVAIEICSFS